MAHDDSLFEEAAARAARYLRAVDARPVAPTAEAVAALAGFDEPLAEDGDDGAAILAQLDALGSPATMATNGRRYFGFVVGGTHPAALAAHCLTLAWDQNAGPRALSPVAAALEEVAGGWLRALFGLPAEAAFAFVTGAGMASFTALAAARRALLLRRGWDVDADGLQGAPAIRVVVSAESHPTILKALGLLGLGRRRVIAVPTDAQGRITAADLPPLDDLTILCLQAGNVNSGAVDPLPEAIAAARAAGAWVHVDGAFGLWARACPRTTALVAGLEDADSWATDGHKWLNLPYENAVCFVRDGAALRGAMAIRAPYLVESGAREPYDTTPDLSRRPRGIDFWAALKALGRRGVADLVDRCCTHAEAAAAALGAAGWEVLNEVVLNQVVAVPPAGAAVGAVVAAIQADGTCWVGPTAWQGRDGIRFSFSSMHTTDADVALSMDRVTALAEAVRRRAG
jgi:glutamate/tyrosine decarboxylase-like PLP-dependent enzyme